MTDARPIGPVKRDAIIPFPTYALMMKLRANGAMAEPPVAGQCSMTALLDTRATLQAIFDQNVAYLDAEPQASFECKRRVKEQSDLNATISILDKIINAKRIEP